MHIVSDVGHDEITHSPRTRPGGAAGGENMRWTTKIWNRLGRNGFGRLCPALTAAGQLIAT